MVHAVLVAGVAQKKPSGHADWLVEPFGQKLPAVQATCCVGVAHTKPAAQAVWFVDPCGQ